MVRRRQMRTDKFFVFTEGRTEEVYFGSDSFRSETKSLEVNPERKRFEGTDAGTYKRWITHLKETGRIRPGDRVWIVLDRDDNAGEDKTAVLTGLAQWCESNGVRLALSNPEFEVWYLLHFVFFDYGVNKQDLARMLKDNLGIRHYEKGADYNADLMPRRDTAMRNARRQRDGDDRLVVDRNPYTNVDLLVADILGFIAG